MNMKKREHLFAGKMEMEGRSQAAPMGQEDTEGEVA